MFHMFFFVYNICSFAKKKELKSSFLVYNAKRSTSLYYTQHPLYLDFSDGTNSSSIENFKTSHISDNDVDPWIFLWLIKGS